jgi:hypothetical protein
MAVSFTVGVKSHLAVLRFDYNDVPRFVLAHHATWSWVGFRLAPLSGIGILTSRHGTSVFHSLGARQMVIRS